jgi:hypothetical protein
MSITLSALQKQRRDTAANWTAQNPTLLAGEIGIESDTGKWKVGDGATAWASLAYIPGLSITAYPLVNADIASNAEIAVSKLADGTARQLLQTDAAGTGVEWASNIDVPGTLDVTGAATFDNNVIIQGDLTVNGTTTTIDTQHLIVEDKNVVIGQVTSPTDVTADGGGITLKGATDKTINWVDATDAWTFSEHVNLASGKAFYINGTEVLSGSALGSGVTSSSLISVGTVTTGTWSASTIAVDKGGTGQTTYTDGQLLIGNTTGNTLNKATLTAGSGVSITNSGGSITISATGSGGTITSVTATSPLASTGGTTPDISIQDGTTAQKGAVQLEDSTSSTSTTKAATPNSVKTAYDLANAALPKAGGTLTGNLLIDNQSDLRFGEATANGSNYVGFQAPASIAADVLWTLPGTDGSANQVLQTNGSGILSWATAGGSVQYSQNIQSANYTLTIDDAGKQIFHPASDTVSRVYTIPANSSVAFSIGTVVLFTVENGARNVSVAITSDTLVNANGLTGTITVPSNDTLACIKVTNTKWMAYRLSENAGSNQAIAVAHNTTPFVTVYPWSSGGFGAKVSDPATLPTGNSTGVAFSPSGDALAVTHSTSPFVTAYPWSGSRFGTKFSNPATLPASTGNGVAFSPSGDALAVAHATTPFISAYPWSSSGFGTKFSNPSTLPASTGTYVAFSPAGDAIAVSHGTTPFISVYPWSGSGFGTKFSDPATLPASTGYGVAFAPSGDAIAVAHTTTPFVSVYPWSGSGFGTKFSNPATLPAGNGSRVAFSPSGDALAVAHATTPFISAYPWSSSGFGTKFSNPATLPSGNTGNDVAFSPAGDAIALAHFSTPFVTAYPWSSNGFGIKLSDPATLPAGTGNGVAFSPRF